MALPVDVRPKCAEAYAKTATAIYMAYNKWSAQSVDDPNLPGFGPLLNVNDRSSGNDLAMQGNRPP
jgi:hypothetical protein